MREIELKLLLDDAQLRAVQRAKGLSERAHGRWRSQTLASQYFDTKDHALRKRGIALRLRKAGRSWLQTVKKAEAQMNQGLSQPLEDECSLPGPSLNLALIADHDLREEVIGVARAGLTVVATTAFKRTMVRVTLPEGVAADVAIDHGKVSAGTHSAPLSELELELVEGAPGQLYGLAAEILGLGPARFATNSKSERALALLSPDPVPVSVRKARRLDLSGATTVEDALAAILEEGVAHYIPNLALLLDTEDAAGPHQVRVALRRLRSALQAFRPALGAASAAPWAEQAQEIATIAGRLRDLDVMIDDVIRPMMDRAPGEAGLADLADHLAKRRAAVRTDITTALAEQRITRFGLDFMGWVIQRGWQGADKSADKSVAKTLGAKPAPFAAKAIAKRWAAVKAYGDRIEGLTIEERHDMRKALKKLRYVVDGFRSLFDPVGVETFVAAIKSLQKAFGALNDAAMAEAILMASDAPGRDDPLISRAIGRVLGHLDAQAEALWPAAIKDWRAMEKTTLFWKSR